MSIIFPRLGIYGWKEADENLALSSLLTGDPVLLFKCAAEASAPLDGKLNRAQAEMPGGPLLFAVPTGGQNKWLEITRSRPQPSSGRLLTSSPSFVGIGAKAPGKALVGPRTLPANLAARKRDGPAFGAA